MAVVANQTGHVIRFEAYDANKQRMDQSDPPIQSGQARYVNQDHLGSADYFIMLAFYETEKFDAPPGVGIIQGVSGGGGGISIAGWGVSASATVTEAFSQPVGAAKVLRHAEWTLRQPGGPGTALIFEPGGNAKNSDLHGW